MSTLFKNTCAAWLMWTQLGLDKHSSTGLAAGALEAPPINKLPKAEASLSREAQGCRPPSQKPSGLSYSHSLSQGPGDRALTPHPGPELACPPSTWSPPQQAPAFDLTCLVSWRILSTDVSIHGKFIENFIT